MRRLRETPADEGFTLTELLVVMVLFAIVGTIVTVASVTALHHQAKAQDRGDAIAQARTALERIDRDIRSAYPLLAASATQLVMQETEASGTRAVTYAVSGGQLTADGKVLLRNVVNPSSSPVFSFTPISNYVAPVGSGVNAATCAMPGGSYDPACVGTVTVQVMVQPATLSPPVSISDHGTALRNVS